MAAPEEIKTLSNQKVDFEESRRIFASVKPNQQPPSAETREEEGLKYLLDCEERGVVASAAGLEAAMKRRGGRDAASMAGMVDKGLVDRIGGEWTLTDEGRRQALEVVRKHRLMETWLARETSVPAEKWHRAAQEAERQLGPGETDRLADRLGNPRFDPHGDPIPTREGELRAGSRVSLGDWPAGCDAVIVHLEDEPEEEYAQMVRMGLHPGMVLGRIERLGDGVMKFFAEGRWIEIPGRWLEQIHVAGVMDENRADMAVRRLSDLPVGSFSRVRGLSPACVGAERRRLLDLGLVPGTEIHCEFRSPFGSPRSYMIRGSMIALRREQADRVLVIPDEGGGR